MGEKIIASCSRISSFSTIGATLVTGLSTSNAQWISLLRKPMSGLPSVVLIIRLPCPCYPPKRHCDDMMSRFRPPFCQPALQVIPANNFYRLRSVHGSFQLALRPQEATISPSNFVASSDPQRNQAGSHPSLPHADTSSNVWHGLNNAATLR